MASFQSLRRTGGSARHCQTTHWYPVYNCGWIGSPGFLEPPRSSGVTCFLEPFTEDPEPLTSCFYSSGTGIASVCLGAQFILYSRQVLSPWSLIPSPYLILMHDIIYAIYVYVCAPECIYVHHGCAGPSEVRVGSGFSGTGVNMWLWATSGCWELKLGLLQEHKRSWLLSHLSSSTI